MHSCYLFLLFLKVVPSFIFYFFMKYSSFIMLVPTIQQSESPTCIDISPLFQIFFPYRSTQSTEQSSCAVQQVLIQFSSVAQSCLTVCNPVDCSTSGFPLHRQLLEFIQTHVHCVSDAIQPSHTLSSSSPPALNLSQHQSLFQ